MHRALRGLSPLHRLAVTPLRTANTAVVWQPHMKRSLEPMPPDFKENPERDTKNFPHVEGKLFPSKVRMLFIPDSWFQFFYKKTGVTGPYLFGAGLISFLVQKEFFIVEHTFNEGPAMALVLWFLYVYVSPMANEYLNKRVSEEDEKVHKFKTTEMDTLAKTIKTEEKEQHNLQGMHYLFDANRENIEVQLEAEYRARLQQAHDEVKRHVDCMVEVEEAKRRFKQKHMVDWIVNEVRKSITAREEAAMLQQCVVDLKRLAHST